MKTINIKTVGAPTQTYTQYVYKIKEEEYNNKIDGNISLKLMELKSFNKS